MQGTLFEGDYVFINKLAYGARLPLSPFSFTKKESLMQIRLPYFRTWGYTKIKRNDILALNFSINPKVATDLQTAYIKRCVAIAGDSIKITDGQIEVNHEYNEPKTVYHNYYLQVNPPLDTLLLKNCNVYTEPINLNYNTWQIPLSAALKDTLIKKYKGATLQLQTLKKTDYNPNCFPNNALIKWNMNHFGPFYIPKKNDSVMLNETNLILYQNILNRYETVNIVTKDGLFYINGKLRKHYVFKYNYYFVIGDNRSNSIDSRIWGCIPEECVFGKASFIINQSKKGKNYLKWINE